MSAGTMVADGGVSVLDAPGREYLAAGFSPNTRQQQLVQLGQFAEWHAAQGLALAWPVPAERVRAYIRDRAAQGLSLASLRGALDMISREHRLRKLGDVNPTKDEDVRLQMRALRRERGAAQAQMTGLRETGLDAIRRTAFEPREFKPGHFEREETARRRATTDIAICSLGREAMLRRSEMAALEWDDLEPLPEVEGGGALITIRESKASPTESVIRAFTHRAWEDLLAMLEARGGERAGSVFEMHSASIGRRIAKAARQAGLSGRYNSHSLRIGMTQDLFADGFDVVQLMYAGRWATPSEVMTYVRFIEPRRSAVFAYRDRRDAESEVSG